MTKALTKKQELRSSIAMYRLMGMSTKDIARTLQVSPEVVLYHLKYYRAGLVDLAYKRSIEELAGECLSVYDLVIRSAWEDRELCEKPSFRFKFLDVILEAQEKKYELLKELGLIDYSSELKSEEKTSFENTTDKLVKELSEQPEVTKFLEQKLTEKLVSDVLPEPEPLADYDKDFKIDITTNTPVEDNEEDDK